jgi:hypothetical protein
MDFFATVLGRESPPVPDHAAKLDVLEGLVRELVVEDTNRRKETLTGEECETRTAARLDKTMKEVSGTLLPGTDLYVYDLSLLLLVVCAVGQTTEPNPEVCRLRARPAPAPAAAAAAARKGQTTTNTQILATRRITGVE